MTLVSDIIRDAYRESNLIAIAAEPTDLEKAEGLRLLNRLLLSVYGNEAGENFLQLIIGRGHIQRPQGFPWYEQVPDQTDWFVPPNVRLVLNLTYPQTLWLTPTPQDGSRFAFIDESHNLSQFPLTVKGNGRRIGDDLEVTFDTDGEAREYLYRSDVGKWMQTQPLGIDDEWPFPEKYDDFFVIGLSFRLNPRHAQEAAPDSIRAYNRSRNQFIARYKQTEEVRSELALIRTPGNRNMWIADTRFGNSAFTSGYPWPYPVRY